MDDFYEDQEAALTRGYSREDDMLDCEEQDWRVWQGGDAPLEHSMGAATEEVLPTYRLGNRLQEAQQTDNVVARGFWRPNRLY
jgi:hypothetical protein